MNPNQVEVHGKRFEIMITRDEIRSRVMELAWEITKKYKHLNPLFIPILNGSFVFAADLVRACDFDSEMMFVKIKSYDGMKSTGKMNQLIGMDQDVEGRHIIIIEDIIDTGNTMKAFQEELQAKNPASISMASFLLKPDAVSHELSLDYIGFRIPNDFVIGYGLDYDELGRTLKHIYKIVE